MKTPKKQGQQKEIGMKEYILQNKENDNKSLEQLSAATAQRHMKMAKLTFPDSKYMEK